MNIISRGLWGARSPKSTPTYVSPSRRVYFVVHHSGAPVTQTVRAIQDWCMDGRGFSDIDYNHLVRGGTGEIYEGRGFDVVGAHTTGYNTVGVGVCVIGDDEISDAAKASVRWLYEQYNQRCGRTLAVRGHRQLATTGTDCPGDRTFAWVHAGMPAPDSAVEDDVEIADLNKTLRDADSPLATISKAIPWQYTGGGIPAGMSTLSVLNRLLQNSEATLALMRESAGDEVDETEIARQVLAGMDYRKIADAVVAAVPADQARDLLDALAARLAA